MPKQEKAKKTPAAAKTSPGSVAPEVAQPAEVVAAPVAPPAVAQPAEAVAAPVAAPPAVPEQPAVAQTAGAKRKQRPTTESTNPKKKQKTAESQAAKRHFKCIMINTKGEVVCTGRYSGRKPKQAGNKACTRIFKNYRDKGVELPEKIIFGIHECTRNTKKKKKYFYVGTRAKLKKPLAITINKDDPATGKHMVIPYNFNNIVKKLTDTACQEYALLSKYDAHDDKDAQPVAKPKKQTKKTKSKKQAPVEAAVDKTEAAATAEKVAEPIEKKADKKTPKVAKPTKPVKVVAKKKKVESVQKASA